MTAEIGRHNFREHVIERVEQLPENFLATCRKMPLPESVLMCPPEHFDVVDVKNPHMQGNLGKVNKEAAFQQWRELARRFQNCGATVEVIAAEADCEDMVFCANQTFTGFDAEGERICVLSQMKHPSRQREVAAIAIWFAGRGYNIQQLPEKIGFEGSGDAIWHPGRGLIWGGCGFRTDAGAYEHLSRIFGVPVIRLHLQSETFYHLDTCFAAVDENTVLVHANALTDEGVRLIRGVFSNVIECDDEEAAIGMACNATAFGGRDVVIQKGSKKVVAELIRLGYRVHEVDTSEFLKSGGSTFCMKMYVF